MNPRNFNGKKAKDAVIEALKRLYSFNPGHYYSSSGVAQEIIRNNLYPERKSLRMYEVKPLLESFAEKGLILRVITGDPGGRETGRHYSFIPSKEEELDKYLI